MSDLGYPASAPVPWRVTHKATGRHITVSAKLWSEARVIGSLALQCDRFDVMCERVEAES
jgi:hypothetical protein